MKQAAQKAANDRGNEILEKSAEIKKDSRPEKSENLELDIELNLGREIVKSKGFIEKSDAGSTAF